MVHGSKFLKLATFHATIYFVIEIDVQTRFSLIHTKSKDFERICTENKLSLFSKSKFKNCSQNLVQGSAPVTLTCALIFVLIFKRFLFFHAGQEPRREKMLLKSV